MQTVPSQKAVNGERRCRAPAWLPIDHFERHGVNQEPEEVVMQGVTNGIFAATNAESL